MTRWVSLHMISLCSLLLSAAAGWESKCLSEDKLNKKVERFERSYKGIFSFYQKVQGAQTCVEAAAKMSGAVNQRSLSPWKYSISRVDNRFPNEIAFAECLCNGCIINGRENMSYNSVPVVVKLVVLRKTPCQRDRTKFVVKKGFETIAVGCTCAVPKSSN
ncbi:interleukin-17C-like [Sander vitreus]